MRKKPVRIAKDILRVILIAVTPWFIFERFFHEACERAIQNRVNV